MLDILLSFRSLSFSLLTFALKLSKFWYLITPLIYALEVIYFAMGVSIWFCKASMMALSSCMLLILTVLCFISSCILKSHKVAMLCRLSGSFPVGSTNRAIKSIYWLLIHVFRFFFEHHASFLWVFLKKSFRVVLTPLSTLQRLIFSHLN